MWMRQSSRWFVHSRVTCVLHGHVFIPSFIPCSNVFIPSFIPCSNVFIPSFIPCSNVFIPSFIPCSTAMSFYSVVHTFHEIEECLGRRVFRAKNVQGIKECIRGHASFIKALKRLRA